MLRTRVTIYNPITGVVVDTWDDATLEVYANSIVVTRRDGSKVIYAHQWLWRVE